MSNQIPTHPSFNLPEPVSIPDDASSQKTHAPAVSSPQPTPPAVQQPIQPGDVISNDWLQAVEHAIRQGIDDPQALSIQIDELRAQYVVGRYGKEIKRQGKKS